MRNILFTLLISFYSITAFAGIEEVGSGSFKADCGEIMDKDSSALY